jgi:hypothetical protein
MQGRRECLLIWLWIIGIILALLLLLLITRVGAKITFHNDTLFLEAKIGLFSIKILPDSPKAKKEPTAKKTENTKEKDSEQDQKKKSRLTFSDIKDAVSTLWPPLKKALDRTRRGVRIHPLIISATVGAANDPAFGAELYGWLHAGVWTVMPQLERMLVIPSPSIHIGIDFEKPKTKLEGSLGLSARIGTLLRVGLTVAIPALKWFLKWTKQQEKTAALQNRAEKKSAA